MDKAISVAILAGGQSSRMGQNKAFLEIGGKAIIERVIERVRPLGDDLRIITNTPKLYHHLNLPMSADIIPQKATLGGVYTAIAEASYHHTLVIGCDQPFLNTKLLRYLADLRNEVDVVVPLNPEGYPQSMHAIYSKNCLSPIKERLDAHRLKVIGFFPDVRVHKVSSEDISSIDPERMSFVNVNTPDDLIVARKLADTLS